MTDEPRRPDPDALLLRVASDAERRRAGRLRVFLGFAPGVGKTYRMLELAQEARRRGQKVLVGIVETHGRPETNALLHGLEVLPRREISYRGQTLSEFDLDRARSLSPDVLLLDELAHTNAPGSRHTKRFQDVEELLEAGVEVWTTANVQHIESLTDVVEQITGVVVREAVPDRLIDRATAIELVDIPPEKLVERLREGKVYQPQQAARAEQNFFRLGNLLALRELALRRTADRVDADVRAYRQEKDIHDTWRAQDRLLVCAGPAPASANVIRAARRLAAGLRCPWSAIYVDSPLTPLSEKDRETLEAHLRLAETLGAEIVRASSPHVADTILKHARKQNVTKILVGKPTHARLRDRLRGSLLDALVRGSGDMDVQVISADLGAGTTSRGSFELPSTSRTREYIFTALTVLATTATGWIAREFVGLPDVEMLYLVAIMAAAAAWGRRASVLAAALSVLAFDFFFVPPFYTFAIADSRHALTFALMFVVGLVISSLVSRLRLQEAAALAREERTRVFYALARDLGGVDDAAAAAETLSRHVAEALSARVAISNAQGVVAKSSPEFEPSTDDLAVAKWVFDNGRPAGRGTDTLPAVPTSSFALRTRGETLAVMTLSLPGEESLAGESLDLLAGLIQLGSLAMARARLAEDARASTLRARTEEMRSALLSGVSHDLRTPLAAITGAATALRDDASILSAAQSRDLIEAICEESSRLERLATNLLDMTRLQAGPLQLKREWVPLEEMASSALSRTEKLIGPRPVSIAIPQSLPLLHVDAVLFEQVFVNLFENAAKYAGEHSRIDLTARSSAAEIEIVFADSGPGIPQESREKVFEKFHRNPAAAPASSGFGLGLPICRGIVEAHGGSMRLDENPGGGARFLISMPLVHAPEEAGAGPR